MFGRRGIRRARYRARAAPVPRALRRDVPAPRARARRDALPRAQHDRDAAQPRPGRRRRPRLPRHGLPDVLVPARRLHRQREPLEGRLPRFGADAVWREIERGAGAGCPTARSSSATCAATAPRTAATSATATCRCSTRTTRATPRGCDSFFRAFGGMDFVAPPPCSRRASRALRPRARARCRGRRAGRRASCAARAGRAPRRRRRALTFVMHSFMDAATCGRRGRRSSAASSATTRGPRDPGAPAGLLVRDGAPGGARAGLRAALGARPAGEPGAPGLVAARLIRLDQHMTRTAAAAVLQLQRSAGSRAVRKMLARYETPEHARPRPTATPRSSGPTSTPTRARPGSSSTASRRTSRASTRTGTRRASARSATARAR